MKRLFLCVGLFAAGVSTTTVFASQFQAATSLNAGVSPRGLAVADLDGDGKTEIISANFGDASVIGEQPKAASGNIVIFKNQVIDQILETGTAPRGLATVDLNNDGLLDIAASFYGDGTVGVYLQQKNHRFGKAAVSPAGKTPVGISAAKVNGQWLVAVANASSNNVSLYKADKKGALSTVATITVKEKPVDVAIFAPVSGGVQLITANFNGNSLSIVELDANFQASATRELELSGNPSRLHLADLNNDNLADLSVALFHDSKVAIYTQQNNTFDGKPVKVKLDGLHPNSLTTVLVNGAPTIVAANRDSGQLDVIGHDSDGDFTVTESLKINDGDDAAFGLAEVAAGDINGDGLSDIVTTHMRSGHVNVFLQSQK